MRTRTFPFGYQHFLCFAVAEVHYQFVALPFGLTSAAQVFTNVLALVLALLRYEGITVIGNLDDLLLWAETHLVMKENEAFTICTLQEFE